MSHDVFISYSSKNKATADAICHTLEEKGIRCFIAPRDIPLGKKYGTVIVEAIERCRVVVLVFSGQSAVSPWVESEINVAFSNRRPIIPYKIDDTNLKNYEEFYFLLNNRHWIESYPDYRERFKELVDAVSAITGIKRPAPTLTPAPSAAPQPVQQPTSTPASTYVPSMPRPKKSRTLAWILGAILFVCVLWGALIMFIASLGDSGAFVATEEPTREEVVLPEPTATPKKPATKKSDAEKKQSATPKATTATKAATTPKSTDKPSEAKPAQTEKAAELTMPTIDYEFCEMVYVEGSTFTMGNTFDKGAPDEKPTHSVTLSNYYIGKYEVTQAQWRTVMGDNPSYFKGDNLPVERVSWLDIQEFIKRLNKMTGKKYRLPTEAEWEYAARGGKRSRGYLYSGSDDIEKVAWYEKNSSDKTHPVGGKQPNELGIYDMTGNVNEWCDDHYQTYSSVSQTNPRGKGSLLRVYRGGDYSNSAWDSRTSARHQNSEGYRNGLYGFRLVLEKTATTASAKSTSAATKTYKVGDYYNIGGKEGVVFEVGSDGQHGKIVALNDLGYLMWNEAKVACAKQGKGWYMPTKGEWQAIYNVKKTLQSTLTNRGTLLGGGFYWSSTEYDASNVWFFDVFEGRLRYADRNNKYINNINTRAVSTF